MELDSTAKNYYFNLVSISPDIPPAFNPVTLRYRPSRGQTEALSRNVLRFAERLPLCVVRSLETDVVVI